MRDGGFANGEMGRCLMFAKAKTHYCRNANKRS